MNPRYEQAIIDVKEEHAEELLALENVHTVAIGPKMIHGQPSDELAIVIFTTKKKPLHSLEPKERIPSHLHGIPTDVIESPKFEPYQTNGSSIPNRNRYRPIPGGAEIFMPSSPYTGGLCTLGMFAHSTREEDSPQDIYLLSNAHCFPRADQSIFQPESFDPDDFIAYASRIVNSPLVDGGIAQLLNKTDAKPLEIIGIGTPRTAIETTLDDIGKLVIKSGRTTGTTIGVLTYLHADADEKKDQIIIVDRDEIFSDHGDSGSIVLFYEGEEQNRVMGLLWGGALIYTVLCPILPVCEELEISLISEA